MQKHLLVLLAPLLLVACASMDSDRGIASSLPACRGQTVDATTRSLYVGKIVEDELRNSPANQGRFEKEADISQSFAHYGQNRLTMHPLLKNILARISATDFGPHGSPCGTSIRFESFGTDMTEMANYYETRSLTELIIGLSHMVGCNTQTGSDRSPYCPKR